VREWAASWLVLPLGVGSPACRRRHAAGKRARSHASRSHARRLAAAVAAWVFVLACHATPSDAQPSTAVPPPIEFDTKGTPVTPQGSAFPKSKGGVFGTIQKIDRTQPLHLQADELVYDNKANRVTAQGNVEIFYDNYILTADRVIYDQGANTLTALGNVVIKEPNGNIIRADRYTLTDDFRDGFVQQLSITTRDDTRITAERANRRDGNVTEFERAKFTPCRTGDGKPSLWCISAARVVHDQAGGTISYQDAQFEILGTPVLSLPYFSHPDPSVKRRSGFLVPDFGYSTTLGFSTELPYYFAIAPNMDFTFNPRYYSMQGVLLQGEWRHRLANGQYTVKFAAIDQDGDQLPDTTSRAQRRELDGWRGSVETRGKLSLGSWWELGWDAIFESDDTFRRFYKLDSVLQTDRINQIYLRGISDRNYFATTFYHFGGLLFNDTSQSEAQVHPVVDYNYIVAPPVLGGELSFNGHAMSLSRSSGSDTSRAILEAQWRRKIIDPLGQVFTPYLHARGDTYRLSNLRDVNAPGPAPGTFAEAGNEELTRGTATAALTWSYPLVAHTATASHLLEPIGQIVARPDRQRQRNLPNEDAQSLVFNDGLLFDVDKFSGYDRLETGTRANVGVQYTFQPYRGGYLRAVLGQSRHLAGDNAFENPGRDPNAPNIPRNWAFNPRSGLETDRSDIVAGFYVSPFDNFRLVSQSRLDDSDLDLRRQDLSVFARTGPFVGQLTYTYSSDQLNFAKVPLSVTPTPTYQPRFDFGTQQDVLAAAGLRLTDRWSLLGMVRFDVDSRERIQDMIQLKYADECFVLTATYTESFVENPLLDIRKDRSVMLRFELKHLGGLQYKTDQLDHLFAENQPRQ
jgi:LPS-assembly protein